MKTCDSQVDEASTLLIDSDGTIVDARDSACSALGWAREDLVNKRMSDVLEFGADVLKERLPELQNDSGEPASFSFLTLIRRQDQSSLPTTALVRRVPELGCFTVSFDDLPGDNHEASRIPIARDQMQGKESAAAPKFRNIFLAGEQRPIQQADTIQPADPVNGRDDTVAQLKTELQERQRLEARVVTLTEQLQQLHVQLGNNLESESICQKKLGERETELRNAEQSRTDAEIALAEERKQREHLEGNLAQINAAYSQLQEEQKLRQQDWAAKLEKSLTDLGDSDARLEAEIATRRGIQESLQFLQQDLSPKT
jgi:PAS domain-containing protein